MRFSTAALVGGFLLVATSAYADDPMAMTYANTVISKDAKGMSSSLLFNQDGTFTLKAVDAKGQPVSIPGTWTLKDDGKTICLTQPTGPNTPPTTSCSNLEAHKVGDTWTVTNDQHQVFTVTLVAGR